MIYGISGYGFRGYVKSSGSRTMVNKLYMESYGSPAWLEVLFLYAIDIRPVLLKRDQIENDASLPPTSESHEASSCHSSAEKLEFRTNQRDSLFRSSSSDSSNPTCDKDNV